jgi:hypothetical protein
MSTGHSSWAVRGAVLGDRPTPIREGVNTLDVKQTVERMMKESGLTAAEILELLIVPGEFNATEITNTLINGWLNETRGLPVTLQLTKLGFKCIEALNDAYLAGRASVAVNP